MSDIERYGGVERFSGIDPATEGGDFTVIGTQTGRISSSEPNYYDTSNGQSDIPDGHVFVVCDPFPNRRTSREVTPAILKPNDCIFCGSATMVNKAKSGKFHVRCTNRDCQADGPLSLQKSQSVLLWNRVWELSNV